MTKTHHILTALCVLACALALSAAPALATEPDTPCPNAQRRSEQPFASALPDCRAYEMVSPLEKDDNGVSYISSRAAMSGEAVTYYSLGSFADPKSALLEGRYLSRRGVGGWSTQNISPPYTDYVTTALENPAFSQLLFTPDLSSGIVSSRYIPLASGQPAGYGNLYVVTIENGSYQVVTFVTPEAEYKPFTENPYDERPQPEGASTDLRHVVFQQRASLCCGASPGRGHVYEWAEGKLSLVDVPPKGVKFNAEDDVGATASFSLPWQYGNPWRAVSANGARVIFTGAEGTGTNLEGQVYVRENPMNGVEDCSVAGDACTVEVSVSQRAGPDPNASKQPAAFYRDASVDGSRVFFTSRVELTNDANTGPEDDAANLYEYDVETGVLHDLTVDNSDPDGAAVLGLVTASDDGSYVYFVAEGRLTNERNDAGEEPVVGAPNLYLSHMGRVRFIATLAPGLRAGDEEDWLGEEQPGNDYGPGQHTVRVTSDGSRLVFESVRELTKYDDLAAEPGDCENERCREVYLYDASTGSLVCASCDPSGARPVGPASLGVSAATREQSGSATTSEPYYHPRNLSEDGGRLFFESPDALVPHDSNGLLDVYEWEQPASPSEEAAGDNSCALSSPYYSASNGSCLLPISDVAGGFESHFMDASSSGNDVFIATADQLVPSDTDAREDVYDVRVGGGFPVSGTPSVCVNANSCKPPISSQPGVFGVPASATFSGSGNPAQPLPPPTVVKPKAKTVKCRKGEVRKYNKCVMAKRAEKGTKKAAERVGNDRRGR
jgi:hypothetical protein